MTAPQVPWPRPLHLRYRPRQWADVLGQPVTTALLQAYAQRDQGRNLCLHGPYGSGKTSLARIYAAALNCHQRLADGSPCLVCESCVQFDTQRPPTHPNYMEFDGASEGSKDRIKEILDIARHPPLWGKWRIICIDEAHGVSPQGLDAMLKLVEEPPPCLVWIFSTTDKQKLRAALISRCMDCEIHLLDQPTSVMHLRQVCQAEQWAAEPAALELIAHLAQGHPRDLLQYLDQAQDYGELTQANAQVVFGLDYIDYLVNYFKGLWAGNLQEQHAALQTWTFPAKRKAGLIQDLILYLLYVEVFALRMVVNPLFGVLRPEDKAALRAGWTAQAAAHGWTPEELFLDQLWRFWKDPVGGWNTASFELQLLKCHDHLHGPRSGGAPGAVRAEKRRRPPGPAFRTSTAATDRRRSHTVEQVGRLYDNVSFLNQDGIVLNTHMTMVYTLLGVTEHAAGAKLLTDFNHRAGTWLRDRKYSYHFVYTHENARDRGFHAHLLTHLPKGVQAAFYDWVESFFGKGRVGKTPVKGRTIPVLVQYKNRRHLDQQRKWQWERLRYLCKELDVNATALDADGRRKPLHELLGLERSRQGNEISKAQRSGGSHAIGPGEQKGARAEGTAPRSAFQRGAWSELYTGWELLRTPRSKLRELRRIIGDEPPAR